METAIKIRELKPAIGAVVAREEEDRVVSLAGFLQTDSDPTDTIVCGGNHGGVSLALQRKSAEAFHTTVRLRHPLGRRQPFRRRSDQ